MLSTLPSPSYLLTNSQHTQTVNSIEQYIAATKCDADYRLDAHALYCLHPPGTRVHGTVMLLHGLASSPQLMAPLMHFLYDQKFNVYAPPGAGHAYKRHRLPKTILRSEIGYTMAREAILSDDELSKYFRKLENIAAIYPPDTIEYKRIQTRLQQVLKQSLPEQLFKNIKCALQILSGTEYSTGLDESIAHYFETDHHRYESYPEQRLAEIAALPGPAYIIGYSMGSVQAVNLCARSPVIQKAVLLAPHLGWIQPESPLDLSLTALGALDLYLLPFPLSTVSACHMTACAVAARMLFRDQVKRSVRDRVDTFCVISEGDDCCDFNLAKEFFDQGIANQQSVRFVYPKQTGLLHSIVPGPDNRFSKALMKEIVRFLLLGQVDSQFLLDEDGDPNLPQVPEDWLQRRL